MNQEKLSDAMNLIDDDLIERAGEARGKKKAKKSGWVKAAAISTTRGTGWFG